MSINSINNLTAPVFGQADVKDVKSELNSGKISISVNDAEEQIEYRTSTQSLSFARQVINTLGACFGFLINPAFALIGGMAGFAFQSLAGERMISCLSGSENYALTEEDDRRIAVSQVGMTILASLYAAVVPAAVVVPGLLGCLGVACGLYPLMRGDLD